MKTIPAQEMKRRGLSALDKDLKEGPVHVIKNSRPQHVALSKERYQAFIAAEEEAAFARVRESLEAVKAGRVRRGTAKELIRELGLED